MTNCDAIELDHRRDQFGQPMARLDWDLEFQDSSRYLDEEMLQVQATLASMLAKEVPLEEVRRFLFDDVPVDPNPDGQLARNIQIQEIDKAHARSAQHCRTLLAGALETEGQMLDDPDLEWIADDVIPWVNRYYQGGAGYLSNALSIRDIRRNCPLEDWKPDWSMPLPCIAKKLTTEKYRMKRQHVGLGMLKDVNENVLEDRGMCIHDCTTAIGYRERANIHQLRFFGIARTPQHYKMQTEDGIPVDLKRTEEWYPYNDRPTTLGGWSNAFETAELSVGATQRWAEQVLGQSRKHEALRSEEFPLTYFHNYAKNLAAGVVLDHLFDRDETKIVEAVESHGICEELRHGVTGLRYKKACPNYSQRLFAGNTNGARSFVDFTAKGGMCGKLVVMINNLICDLEHLLGKPCYKSEQERLHHLSTIVTEVDGKMTGMAVSQSPKVQLAYARSEIVGMQKVLESGMQEGIDGIEPADFLIQITILMQLMRQMGYSLPTGNTFSLDRLDRYSLLALNKDDAEVRLNTKMRYKKIFNYGQIDEPPFPAIDESGELHAREAGDPFTKWASL